MIDAHAGLGLAWQARLSAWSANGWRSTVGEGGEIPDGYGIAYYEMNSPTAVVMPIPFNLIVGAWRALCWWAMCPPWRFLGWRLDRQRKKGFEEGWMAHGGHLRSDAFADAERRRPK